MSISEQISALQTDKTNIRNAILTKGGTSATENGFDDFATDIATIPSWKTTFTLATHQSTNVTLCTLPSEVYSHINDETFAVTMYPTDASQIVRSDDYYITASNNSGLPLSSSYTVYGVGLRKGGDTVAQLKQVYYPPKDTTNKLSLGGIGKFYHTNDVLYYRSNDYFLGAGTYNIIISW